MEVFDDTHVFEKSMQQIIEKAKKPMKLYQIIQGRAGDVEHEVSRLLTQGWVCQGGISMHQDWFSQAMVLETHENKLLN
jgi:hypothetical protein